MSDESKRDASEPFAEARGSATWRLLDRRDAIGQSDEILCDDCETWIPLLPNSPHVGQRYDGNLFVPMRRKSPNAAHKPSGDNPR